MIMVDLLIRAMGYTYNNDFIKQLVKVNPENNRIETTNDMDMFIWSMLVLAYGDYGTSPRSGWITDFSDYDMFIDKLLDTIMEGWNNDI